MKLLVVAGFALFLLLIVGLLLASRAYGGRDARYAEALAESSRQRPPEPPADPVQEALDARWREHWRARAAAFDASALAAWLARRDEDLDVIAQATIEFERELFAAVERMVAWTTETAEWPLLANA